MSIALPRRQVLHLCLCLSSPLLALFSVDAWSQSRHFDIPAGTLDATIRDFSAASGVTVEAGGNGLGNLRSPGLQGDYQEEQALRLLLQGSGLELTKKGKKRYRLTSKQQAANAAGSATQLATVTVTAAGLPSTSEGSGSYTTGAMRSATKLPLTERETPQSTTVITRQRMDDQGMTSVNDVVRYTPGLFLSQADGPGRWSYKSRGFNIDNIMYDGMPASYVGYEVGVQPNLAMYDRVEVVRGATGLVTGSGNPSAAINMVRKKPTAKPQMSLTGAAGRWDNYRGELDTSGPLNASGTLRGRVIGTYQDSDGFRHGEAEDHGLLYGITEADLGENTTLTLGAYRQTDRFNLFWGGLPIGANGHHLDLPRSTNPATDWEIKKQHINSAFAELEHWFANDWSLHGAALYSWQHALFSGTYLDSTEGKTQHSAYQSRHDEKQGNFDLYVSGPLHWLGRQHELVAGVSYRADDMTTLNYDAKPRFLRDNQPKPMFTSYGKTRDVTSQSGAYVTGRFSLADPLKLILGGRLDWYEFDDKSGDGDFKPARNLTRYAGLIYDLDKYHSIYASYTDIFQPQSQKDSAGKQLQPIDGKNYEVGIKGEYLNGALNASAALFKVDQENLANQLTDQSGCPTFPATYCFEGAGLVRSQGIDLELQGALTPRWQMGAGYTYAHAEYKKDGDPNNVGKRFDSATPEHLVKLSTLYKLPGNLDKWRAGASLYWQNRIFNEVPVDDGIYKLQQGSYLLADLSMGYQASKRLDVQLNLNNVFDRRYYSAIADSYDYGGDTYGNPRSYLLTARYKVF